MAALTITAASVVAGSGAIVERGTAGATITAGQLLYKDTNDSNKFKLADADGTGLEKNPYGIALNGASSGQPVSVLRSGAITIGATLTPGTTYYAAPTPGGIGPLADVASGDDPIIVGIAASASVLNVGIQDPGVTI